MINHPTIRETPLGAQVASVTGVSTIPASPTTAKDGAKIEAVLVLEGRTGSGCFFNVEKRKPAGDSTHEHQ